MIQYYIKEQGKLKSIPAPEARCWINLSPPFTGEELEEFAQHYDIPYDFLTDPLDMDERARYEREDDVRLIVINTPVLNEGHRNDEATYVTVPIGIILSHEQVITITSSENTVLELFLENKVKNFDPSDESLFVLQILEQNIFRFLNCLKKLNLKRNLVEKELYDSSRNEDLKQLLSIHKSLIYFLNSLSANELLKMKMKRNDFLHVRDHEEKIDLLEDIIIDNSQAMAMANIYTNILSSTMETHSSIISNNLGMIMQRLSLITILISVPTLVASFFGMNVPLPLNTNPMASLFILIFSIFASLLLAWFFRRKRLL